MFIRTALCSAALLLCAPYAAQAQDKAPATRAAQDLASQIDATIAPYFLAEAPGATVLVVKDGKPILRRAYGMADTAKGIKMTPEMAMRIGSMTKQFTATAILLLLDEGKLSLQDEITRFIPDYPTQGRKITVEHLLTHTSGIVSYTGRPGFSQRAPQDTTVAALIDSFKNDPMQFEPGTQWRYNNSGYVLLGAIIEKVSGQPYHAFLEQRIFVPLGMAHTAYEGHERSSWPTAAGHSALDKGFGPARQLGKNQSYAAGELVSTVDDLAKWDAAVGKKLLKPATWQRAFTSYRLADGKDSNYGYGWELTLIQGEPTVGHSGSTRGYRSYGLRVPGKGIYVAVLTNGDSGTVVPDVVARRAAAVAIGKPLPEFKEVALDAAALDAVAGVYTQDKDTNSQRVLRRDGEYLALQRQGRGPLVLKAMSANEFFIPDTADWIVFQREGGKVTGMTMYQDGRALVHTRSGEAPPPRVVARISDAAFDAHAGRYEMQPGMVFEVLRDGSRYFVQPTGQRRVEIFPLSESRFFARDVDAELGFDAQGLNFRQGSRNMVGRKL